MEYYEILKQRRLSLGLSIQDISSQTRLAPQYIRAVEENNLMAFNDDFLFIRRFTQAYCEAIGVNWAAVSDAVESNITAYAQRSGIVFHEDTEVVPSQPEVVEDVIQPKPNKNTKTVQRKRPKKAKPQPKKRKKKSSGGFRRFIKRINESEHARLYQIGALIVALVIVLSLVNVGMSYQTTKQQEAEEQARQTEIAQKEAETKRLASQKTQSEKANNTVTISATDKDNNMYQVDGIVDDSKQLTLRITVPKDTTIAVYKDDELLTNDADEVFTSTFEKTFNIDEACTIQVEIGTYSNNKITVNGKKLSFSKKNWTKGDPAVLYFELTSDSSSDKDTDSSTTDSSDSSTTDSSSTDTADTQTTYDTDTTNAADSNTTDDTSNVDVSGYTTTN